MAELSFDDLIPSPKPNYGDAISSIESGGNYRAVGPATKNGARALGKYQVMDFNVGPWSEEIIGRKVSPQEFIANPEIQDRIFQGKFGQYTQKYGPEGAAKAWFAGEQGMNNPNAKDVLGTTVAGYAAKFNRAVGSKPTDVSARAKAPVDLSFDDLIPQSEPAPAEVAPSQEEVARARLAEGLKAGRNNDAEIYRTAAFRTNQGVPAAGATDAAINGATLGFGDEASAAARAPIDMVSRGESFDEAYQHNLAAERDRLDQYRKASPITSKAAEIAGSLVTPVGRAGAVKTGLTVGTITGAGNSEGDLPQRAADAAVGGATGAALGGAISGVAKLVGGKGPSPAPSIGDLKEAAKKLYNSDAVKGLEVNPEAVKNMATGIRARLDDIGFDENIATKAHGILKKLDDVPPEAVAVTGQNLRSLQKTLGKAAGSIDPQEKAAATVALAELNKFLENIPAAAVIKGSADDFTSAVRTANANYSAAKAAEGIDAKVIQAETRAAAANSGRNVANTVRQRMADVVLKPKQQRGLTDDEVAMADQIARGTKTENALRTVGNILGGGGGLGTLASGAAGGAAFGPAGMALPALGFVLRSIGNKMTLKQAEKLSETIRSRAPLASSSTKFEEAVAKFQEQRNAKTAAAAGIAARNLANNLRGSGFNVSVSDLMRALQGPVAGRAEDEQK